MSKKLNPNKSALVTQHYETARSILSNVKSPEVVGFLEKMLSTVSTGISESLTVASNNDYPAKKSEQIAKVIETATSANEVLAASVQAVIREAKEDAARRALPVLKKDDALSARADVQMLLANATTPEAQAKLLVRLAQRQDSMGALAASDWSKLVLEMAYPDDPMVIEAYTGMIRESAVRAALASDDGDRKAAAEEYVDNSAGQALTAVSAAVNAGNGYLTDIHEVAGYDEREMRIAQLEATVRSNRFAAARAKATPAPVEADNNG